MQTEILHPDDDVPASVYLPKVVDVVREPVRFGNIVTLADRGVWLVDDRAVAGLRQSPVDAMATAIDQGGAAFVARLPR